MLKESYVALDCGLKVKTKNVEYKSVALTMEVMKEGKIHTIPTGEVGVWLVFEPLDDGDDAILQANLYSRTMHLMHCPFRMVMGRQQYRGCLFEAQLSQDEESKKYILVSTEGISDSLKMESARERRERAERRAQTKS